MIGLTNLSSPTISSPIVIKPSFQVPIPNLQFQTPFRGQGRLFPFLPTQTGEPTKTELDVSLSQPSLWKRQDVIIALEIVTVVTVVPIIAVATPVVVTLTVPPPTNTQLSTGGWPIIDPGSVSACWSDIACNSVCPNFQQNGWYAHCMDSACTQCRCQIISSSMCNGTPYKNATWSNDAPARTITLGPAVATVTVMMSSASNTYQLMPNLKKYQLSILFFLTLISWFSISF
ncbi:hypothetical protein DFH28DRAFT_9724 [Melampsora americana]|nr:hypothetical protein DFH28DRAFT_9724 [Melampsora americana]